jgi:hypothetical protein
MQIIDMIMNRSFVLLDHGCYLELLSILVLLGGGFSRMVTRMPVSLKWSCDSVRVTHLVTARA